MFQTTPTNLFEYYTGQNKSLPSIAERGQIYEQQGLGSASLYGGTAEQNTALLGKLQSTPDLSTSTPTIITTDKIRDGFTENVNNLNQRLGMPVASLTIGIPSPQQKTSQKEEAQPETPNFLNISTLNPALQNLGGQVNNTLAQFQSKGGTITPEIQGLLNQINAFELDKGSAMVGAKATADKKDALGLDESMKKVGETETAQQEALNKLISELKTSRETFIESLTPTERETELKTKLNTLRTERKLLPLELRQEGISAAGIQGRQIDDERVRAIQESNMLFEIGLEQDARQYKSSAKEKQVGFITDDIDLQFKIQDRLDKQEKNILDQARDLRKDSLAALSDILDSFERLAWEDLDAETQAEVIDMAKQFNIPLNVLASAMKNAKQQQIYERSIEVKKLLDESDVDIRQRKKDLADLLAQVPTFESREEALSEMDKYKSSIITRIGEEGFNKIQNEINRLFPSPAEAGEEKIGEGGIFGTIDGFFQRLFGK